MSYSLKSAPENPAPITARECLEARKAFLKKQEQLAFDMIPVINAELRSTCETMNFAAGGTLYVDVRREMNKDALPYLRKLYPEFVLDFMWERLAGDHRNDQLKITISQRLKNSLSQIANAESMPSAEDDCCFTTQS